MSRFYSIFIVVLVGMSSCKKDEIDLAALNSNPFDRDYSGEPIFTVVSESTTITTIDGELVMRVGIVVQTHAELFGRQTPYLIQVLNNTTGTESVIASNSISSGQFYVSTRVEGSGDVRCWTMRVGNAGTFGGGNQVCGTAE